jgi:hypothetical protein
MMYRIFAAGVFILYTVAAWQGWELGSSKRGRLPQEMRQQAGGYRSYHFWRGGK